MRRKREINQKTNLQANVQERSHLEGGQESKLVDAQTKLQPKPNQTSSNVTCKHSCSLAKMQNQKKNRERDKEDEKE